jgi:hypothetical protein
LEKIRFSVDSNGVGLRFQAAKHNARIFALVKKRGAVACAHLMMRCVVLRYFWIGRSGGLLSVVIPQHPTQSFPACHVTGDAVHFIARLYQLVVESLMVSLLMIMSKEISHNMNGMNIYPQNQYNSKPNSPQLLAS